MTRRSNSSRRYFVAAATKDGNGIRNSRYEAVVDENGDELLLSCKEAEALVEDLKHRGLYAYAEVK